MIQAGPQGSIGAYIGGLREAKNRSESYIFDVGIEFYAKFGTSYAWLHVGINSKTESKIDVFGKVTSSETSGRRPPGVEFCQKFEKNSKFSKNLKNAPKWFFGRKMMFFR